jgi:hypothetical protein
LNGGQQQRNQNCNDGSRDQELDQRKTRAHTAVNEALRHETTPKQSNIFPSE